jgi:hypothetical protein
MELNRWWTDQNQALALFCQVFFYAGKTVAVEVIMAW